MNHKLQLSKQQMREFGYKVIDNLVEHFDTQHEKPPVCLATRQQMDELLYESVPLESTDAQDVLTHVINDVMSNCGIPSHPKILFVCARSW